MLTLILTLIFATLACYSEAGTYAANASELDGCVNGTIPRDMGRVFFNNQRFGCWDMKEIENIRLKPSDTYNPFYIYVCDDIIGDMKEADRENMGEYQQFFETMRVLLRRYNVSGGQDVVRVAPYLWYYDLTFHCDKQIARYGSSKFRRLFAMYVKYPNGRTKGDDPAWNSLNDVISSTTRRTNKKKTQKPTTTMSTNEVEGVFIQQYDDDIFTERKFPIVNPTKKSTTTVTITTGTVVMKGPISINPVYLTNAPLKDDKKDEDSKSSGYYIAVVLISCVGSFIAFLGWIVVTRFICHRNGRTIFGVKYSLAPTNGRSV